MRGEGESSYGKKGHIFGKSSIILQFTFSVILVISSILITRQVQYLLKADVGYNTDQVVQVKLHTEGLPLEKISLFKEELKRSPLISRVAYSSNIPGEVLGTAHFKMNVDGEEASKIVSLMTIDADYLPLMEMELKEGRNFREDQVEGGVILNEACIDFFALGDSLAGRFIRNIEILGVLKGGRYNSLHDDSKPIIFTSGLDNRGYMNVKLGTGDLLTAMEYIQSSYESIFDALPFEATFMDHTVEQMYRDDISQSKLLGLFTGLSIVIANIGLFGLVALLNRRRTKEIGIRKVNGALRWQIALLLGKQLFVWVLVAVLIAIPITIWVSKLWLQNFATRINFSWWIIPLGGLVILLSAVLTTAVITFRTANRNPVDVLRCD